jgi:hypothetical protein
MEVGLLAEKDVAIHVASASTNPPEEGGGSSPNHL